MRACVCVCGVVWCACMNNEHTYIILCAVFFVCLFVYGGSCVVDDAITLVWVSFWKQPPGGVFLGFTDKGGY